MSNKDLIDSLNFAKNKVNEIQTILDSGQYSKFDIMDWGYWVSRLNTLEQEKRKASCKN